MFDKDRSSEIEALNPYSWALGGVSHNNSPVHDKGPDKVHDNNVALPQTQEQKTVEMIGDHYIDRLA